MSARVLIEAGIGEVRAALIEDDRLTAIAIDRGADFDPGADIILARAGRATKRMNVVNVDLPGGSVGLLPLGGSKPPPEGKALILQVDRAAHGLKGPRLSADLALNGRFLVYRPHKAGVGLSRGTKDEPGLAKKWTRLAKIGGFQLKPAITGADDASVEAEASRLIEHWRRIQDAAEKCKPPAVIEADLPPTLRLLRDAPALDEILVDDAGEASRLKEFFAATAPDLAAKIELNRGPGGLFSAHGIEDDIDGALGERIELPGGVAMSIQATEALTAVDVDAGGAVDIPTACAKAAAEIARQVRLRRLGGQIVVDFPRAESDAARRKIADRLRAALSADPEPIEFGGLTRLGLVEFTRRRRGPSLAELLGARRRGFEPTAATVARALMRAALAESRKHPGRALRLRAAPAVAELLLGEDAPLVQRLRARAGVEIRVEVVNWPIERHEAAGDG